jgi:ABC-2 type transport system ATP-binding protein
LNTRLMAVGTAQELEQSIRGRKTVIKLREVNDAIVDSLKRLDVKNLAREGNDKLIVDVANPEEENPDMVKAIVAAGGRIETVSILTSTLEDAYLKLVKEESQQQ